MRPGQMIKAISNPHNIKEILKMTGDDIKFHNLKLGFEAPYMSTGEKFHIRKRQTFEPYIIAKIKESEKILEAIKKDKKITA